MRSFLASFSSMMTKKCMLINYHCKQKKNVHLMLTLHDSLATDTTEKKKPLVILFYNHNKVGVDVFDQMVRLYTTHAATIEDCQLQCGQTY